MSLRNEVRRIFRQDPEKALALVRENLDSRQRRIVALLDGLLEETDRLIAQDPGGAMDVAESVLGVTAAATSARWVRARAFGVLASAYDANGRSGAALRLIERGLETGGKTFERGALLARRSVALCQLSRWREALRSTHESVATLEGAEIPRETDFCSLASALAVRSWVRFRVLTNAPDLAVKLREILEDCGRCLDVVGKRRSLRGIAAIAVNNYALAVSCCAFEGYPVEGEELSETLSRMRTVRRRLLDVGVSRSSVLWAKSLYLEGLLRCQIRGTMSVKSEGLFLSARELMMSRNAVADAVSLTLDYQWWLLRSGRGHQALGECDFLAEHAAGAGPHEGVVLRWVSALRARRIAAELRMVFRNVRGIRNVRLPKPVRRRPPPGW